MDIPFYKKENINDCGCAPVCLRMALAYFGIDKNIDEIYQLCEALGTVHYTLPWGMCIAGSKVGLYSTFISKNPMKLLQSSKRDISFMTGISIKNIERIERRQVNICKGNKFIQLLKWRDEFRTLPERLIRSDNTDAVVIPTVWWGTQPHNIVLVNYKDSGEELCWTTGPQGWKDVYYHDPNGEDTLPAMPEKEFFKKWIHPYTDNDILIFTAEKLNL